jgi:LacI family transcriptional regulator, galactose operon repressor
VVNECAAGYRLVCAQDSWHVSLSGLEPNVTASSVGIKDVALRAGVSLGTVSNVLNNPSVVSPATRERVERAIGELGYVRNESARQLRAGSSRTLAYVVLDASNPFFTDVARGAQQVAEEAGLGLYLCNSNQDPTVEHRYLDLLVEQRVRGVLITPIDPDGDELTQLPERGIPLVMVDRSTDSGSCSVSVDDIAGGALAARHLLEHGHRRIVYVGGPTTLPQVRDRHDGARKVVRAAGLADDALLSMPTEAMTVADGRLAGQQVLALPAESRPTAAFCANDLLALGFLQAMTRQGVEVPGQMAIVGYDDIEFAEAAAVPLTSVRQPREQLGRTAAQLLLEEAEAAPGHVHRQVQFQPELIVRASTTGFAATR